MLDKTTYRALKQKVAIKECGEKLVEISAEFLRFSPHPYEKLNAPYSGKSPFFLRESVVSCLLKAQERLDSLKRGYRLKIFDGLRPISVQRFMIEYDTNKIALERFNTAFKELSDEQKKEVDNTVSYFWSPINDNIELSPPPHSTGGALDLSIVDADGIELDMGTDIDELVDASESNYYEGSGTLYESNRKLLVEVMTFAGFTQLPTEWWHFSYGDQIWALDNKTLAKYGIYIKSV